MWLDKRSPIAIDFGDHAVKITQLERHGGKLRVRDACCVKLEPIGSGAGKPGGRMLQATRRALDLGSFRGRACISALRLYETNTQHIRVGLKEFENLEGTLQQEIEERFPDRGGSMVCQSIPVAELVERGERQQELLCCFAESERIEEYLALLQELNLEPVALELDSCAQLRPFWHQLRREVDQRAHAYIDIGSEATRLTVALGLRPVLMNVTPVGGRHFLKMVHSSLKIELDELLDIHEEDKANQETSIGICASLVSVLDSQLDLIVQRLKECIRYFGTIFRGQKVELIRVLGGAADLPGVVEELGRRVGIPAESADPFALLGTEIPRLSRGTPPGIFTTSLGLALRGMG